MKKQKRNKWICILSVASMVVGMVISPLQNVVVFAEEKNQTVRSNVNKTGFNDDDYWLSYLETETPEVTDEPETTQTPKEPEDSMEPEASKSPETTATPSVSESPKPTAIPVMTPIPGANPLLGAKEYETVYLNVGQKGKFDIARNADGVFDPEELKNLTSVTYDSMDTDILSVSEDGSYQAIKVGTATVTVRGVRQYLEEYYDGYYEQYTSIFSESFTICVIPDMTKVTLEKDSLDLYYIEGFYANSWYDEGGTYGKIKINSSVKLDDAYDDLSAFSYSSSNSGMNVYCSLENNELLISCSDEGETELTVKIYGKEFKIHLQVTAMQMSATSLLMAQHKTKKLKLIGYSKKISWKSSRPAVASINEAGVIKAKKQGNTLITTKINGCKVGCVVSVVSSKKKKVIARAIHIGNTCKYSQAKRMSKGYYDCSSLVWRAYAAFGIKIGGVNYAPTSAADAEWCAKRHRLLKGGFSQKNVQKLKINAGDLLFETGSGNGRYKGVYHVEMFVGYALYGFDQNGKPILSERWANRGNGHYPYGCGLIGKM